MQTEHTTENSSSQENPQHSAQAACVNCATTINPAEVAMRTYDNTGHLCLDCYARMEMRQCELGVQS